MAFWTLGRVKLEVRNNLDDPQGTYLTDDFLDPKIQTVYEKFATQANRHEFKVLRRRSRRAEHPACAHRTWPASRRLVVPSINW